MVILIGISTVGNSMNDWDQFLAKAGLEFMAGRNPYGHGFGNPPWSLFFLGPLGNVSPWVAMTFPTIALLFLSVRFRKPYLLLVVGTSFPFICTSAFGNLDWMVMLGAAIGGPLGVILDTIKPQDGLFA